MSIAEMRTETAAAGDGGAMWIHEEFRATLANDGLTTFDAVINTRRGRLLRALRDRENWRLELHAPHATATSGAYLKKHRGRTLATWLRAKLGRGPGATAGRVEAENVVALERHGVAAMRVMAFGERLSDDGRLESFVLTEELTGYTQLDHFLRRRFPARAERPSGKQDQSLRTLLARVADVAARFHGLGYNHRDLYCCHFFIRETTLGEFDVRLIDLQRVEHRRRFRRRWIVKDLAQLAYSAPKERISCAERMAFIKRYLGVRKLRADDKRLIRLVLAKQQIMERNLGPHP